MYNMLKDIKVAIVIIASILATFMLSLAVFFLTSFVVSIVIYMIWYLLSQIDIGITEPVWRTSMVIAIVILSLKSAFND